MTITAIRWSGLVLIVGAVLLGAAIVKLSFNPVVTQQFTPDINLLLLISSILFLLSLPGMYAKQVHAAGWLGLTGFALLQIGIVFIIVVSAPPLLYPTLKEPLGPNPVIFLLGVAFTFGLLLTSIATLRAGVFPRWAGILLLAATIGFFFDFFIAEFLPPVAGQIGNAFFGILLALALSWIGLSIWRMPS